MMDTVLKKIGDMGLVPVVVMDDAALAPDTAKALIDGGLDVMEITMRTDQGIAAIREAKKAYPGMLIGAGTVLSVEKAEEAVDAGAEFIVSPGLNPALVRWCLDQGIAVTPGCVTPTEIERALECGLSILKFFPANLYGGIDGCKALYGPYRMVRFIPTGGISLQTLGDYADKPYVHAIGGGWLCKPADINAGHFDAITAVVRQSIDTLLGFELAHAGINAGDAEASLQLAEMFDRGFGFPVKKGNSSNFAGPGIEVMKSTGMGAMGHLAVRTNSIGRAVYYLGKRGYAVDPDTYKWKGNKPVAVYLKDDFGGFAVHLLQK
jgi:2-dehydro-3-deoxyphosphogluconate aldolase/(4S)-4-hydroxy-2-oxoglutarate aldolase